MKLFATSALLCALLATSTTLASPQEKPTPPPSAGAPTAQPAPPPGNIFDSNELDQMPELVQPVVRPKYPFTMKKSQVAGEVLIRFTVGSDGRLYNLKVKRASHPDFVEPTLKAIPQWRFKPGIKNGQPVNCRLAMPIVFSPTES